MSYDPDGRRTGFVNELDGTWVYSYRRALGRVESVTDPDQRDHKLHAGTMSVTARVGHPTRRQLQWRTPDRLCITYTYDLAGRPTGVDYADPATPDITAITYDALGRRTSASVGAVTLKHGCGISGHG
jgi:hypothetical protein